MTLLTAVGSPARGAATVAAVGFLADRGIPSGTRAGCPSRSGCLGGTRTHLPKSLRIASAIAAVFWVLAALIVLGYAGFQVSPISGTVARWGTWVLVGVLLIGALMNFASSSPWERFLWGPLALLLAVLCFVLARS